MAIYDKYLSWLFPDGTRLITDATPIVIGTPKIYIVGVNESLLDISNKLYRNHSSWYIIANANNVIDPYEDLSGVSLIIPSNG